jgi:hypothetical protein
MGSNRLAGCGRCELLPTTTGWGRATQVRCPGHGSRPDALPVDPTPLEVLRQEAITAGWEAYWEAYQASTHVVSDVEAAMLATFAAGVAAGEERGWHRGFDHARKYPAPTTGDTTDAA